MRRGCIVSSSASPAALIRQTLPSASWIFTHSGAASKYSGNGSAACLRSVRASSYSLRNVVISRVRARCSLRIRIQNSGIDAAQLAEISVRSPASMVCLMRVPGARVVLHKPKCPGGDWPLSRRNVASRPQRIAADGFPWGRARTRLRCCQRCLQMPSCWMGVAVRHRRRGAGSAVETHLDDRRHVHLLPWFDTSACSACRLE